MSLTIFVINNGETLEISIEELDYDKIMEKIMNEIKTNLSINLIKNDIIINKQNFLDLIINDYTYTYIYSSSLVDSLLEKMKSYKEEIDYLKTENKLIRNRNIKFIDIIEEIINLNISTQLKIKLIKEFNVNNKFFIFNERKINYMHCNYIFSKELIEKFNNIINNKFLCEENFNSFVLQYENDKYKINTLENHNYSYDISYKLCITEYIDSSNLFYYLSK